MCFWKLASYTSAEQVGRLETQGKVDVAVESKVSLPAEFQFWGSQSFFFSRPSTDQMRPTDMEDYLLYAKSTDLSVNLT